MIQFSCDAFHEKIDPSDFMADVRIVERVHLAVPAAGRVMNTEPQIKQTQMHLCRQCWRKVEDALKLKE